MTIKRIGVSQIEVRFIPQKKKDMEKIFDLLNNAIKDVFQSDEFSDLIEAAHVDAKLLFDEAVIED